MIRVLSLLALFVTVAAAVPAQGKDKKDVAKTAIGMAGQEDPFTQNDPKAMARLGVVGYGPLEWADNLRTTDIETVLGEGRFLWMETTHFRIGSSLGFVGAPKDTTARKLLKEELKRLNRKVQKIPASRSKLDPWLRLHLYALRAEELYAEFAELCGKQEEGKHLGREQKFLLLLFQQKSDLARYFDRFAGRKVTGTQDHYHSKTGHYAVILTAEGQDGPRDCETVHAQFRYFLFRMFLDAAGGAPWWLRNGLAHWYERQVPCNLINCGIRDDESVEQSTQNDWERKMQKRCKHPELCVPFSELCKLTDFGYYGSVESWSRVDYLQQDRERFGRFLRELLAKKTGPNQFRALEDIYELTPEAFDVAWQEWAVKAYK